MNVKNANVTIGNHRLKKIIAFHPDVMGKKDEYVSLQDFLFVLLPNIPL